MALFGQARDISMFRHVNRELMQNIISQQCAFYQIQLNETVFNMYGEASQEKYYNGPFLLYALIEIPEQNQPTDDIGVTFEWGPTFRFLRDDLTTGSLGYTNLTEDIVPQIGDIIFWEEGYYEIHATDESQYFVGKNPDYPNSQNGPNPLETDLAEFGYNVSIICNTHYIPADKVGLSKERT
jgi:hypothetical protein